MTEVWSRSVHICQKRGISERVRARSILKRKTALHRSTSARWPVSASSAVTAPFRRAHPCPRTTAARVPRGRQRSSDTVPQHHRRAVSIPARPRSSAWSCPIWRAPSYLRSSSRTLSRRLHRRRGPAIFWFFLLAERPMSRVSSICRIESLDYQVDRDTRSPALGIASRRQYHPGAVEAAGTSDSLCSIAAQHGEWRVSRRSPPTITAALATSRGIWLSTGPPLPPPDRAYRPLAGRSTGVDRTRRIHPLAGLE